jgi:hypothetical protein
MNKIIYACLIAVLLTFNGCGSKTESSSEAETTSAAVLEKSTVAETTEPTTRDFGPESYTHGEDGYYNIADEISDFDMKKQEGGTCWLYAGVAGMGTAYAKKYGRYPSIEPLGLLDINYINERKEGFIPKEGVDPIEVGGWQWVLTETMTNGFGDYVIDSSVIFDVSDHDAIKKNLHERGGVVIGVNDTDQKYTGWYKGYNTMNYSIEEYDHDITIIGYDDHFPKQYFNEPASEDGAWICYNSACPSEFFYVSYCAPLEYGISHSVTDEYSEVLTYDAGNEQDRYIKTGDSTTTANVFHKAGTLAAVGTYNDFDEQDITIEIYDADFKNRLYSQDAVLDYHGYNTIKLDTPVDVTDYAVAITYSKGAPVEGEDIDYGQADYKTVSESGQSFVMIDSNWKDLTDSDIESAISADFKPNNCCIKALYL